MGTPDRRGGSRRRAALVVVPLLAIGLFNVVLLLGWGLEPLWAFMILPPILFMCALAWLAVRSGFVGDATESTDGV
jgi:hypothetical protein